MNDIFANKGTYKFVIIRFRRLARMLQRRLLTVFHVSGIPLLHSFRRQHDCHPHSAGWRGGVTGGAGVGVRGYGERDERSAAGEGDGVGAAGALHGRAGREREQLR